MILLLAALLVGSILATPASADVTLSVPIADNTSAPCLDLFDAGCALQDTAGGFSASFTFPTADLPPNSGSDWCFSPDSSANLTQLSLGGADSLSLQTTSLCLTSDPSDGTINDHAGAFTGAVHVISGTAKYADYSGNGTFSGLYSGLDGSPLGSILFDGIEFDFQSYDLSLTPPPPPPPPCTDLTCGTSGGPNPSATPELDSLTLFGSALVGLSSYAVLRRRAGGRR
jgi:hypothetical protein